MAGAGSATARVPDGRVLVPAVVRGGSEARGREGRWRVHVLQSADENDGRVPLLMTTPSPESLSLARHAVRAEGPAVPLAPAAGRTAAEQRATDVQ